MKLSRLNPLLINELNSSFTVFKWMSGNDWRVRTKEGNKGIGDNLIPLWVGGDKNTLSDHFSLVYNNWIEGNEIYLAVIEVDQKPNAVTDKEFTTYEWDFEQNHEVGSPAIKGNPGDSELLIMRDCKLIDLYLCKINEDYTKVIGKNINGKTVEFRI